MSIVTEQGIQVAFDPIKIVSLLIKLTFRNNMYRKIVQLAFTLSCWTTFSFMAIFWLYKYKVTDRDIGVVSFLSLEDAVDFEFPMPYFCLIDPFVDKKFNTTQSKVKGTEYLDYLKGVSKSNSVELVEYKGVTLNLNDYFLYVTEQWKNDSDTTFNSSLIVNHENVFNGFNSKDEFIKCFALDVDLSSHRYIKTINFHYNTTKLLTDWKGSNDWTGVSDSRSFGIKFHGKNHFLIGDEPLFRTYFRIEKNWFLHFWEGFEFTIYELEFFEGRYSKNNRCGHDLLNYDDEIMKKYISHKGCRAPYLNEYSSFPLCNTSNGISFAKLSYGKTKTVEYDRPCKRIAKLLFNDGGNAIENMENVFRIRITFPDEVKTMVQSKEVDIHTLIGNIGGYLGLFMGYAVVQIPSLIFGAYDLLKAKSQSLSQSSYSPA